ncbi:uncharacterized protein LOC112465081 [Temnothorax curvispinosus]|uniref:Uncharacterized protein LOC112465081 n=1 Tax=Temnothorax curvispinosus TaxID=300111 RepID=A0A6J1R0S4_9HYME|nr:uncharacterized protein LOC112465081 [Temnothorax curvispinosus]
MVVELPLEKQEKVKSKIDNFRVMKQCKIRDFASFVGTLVSCCITLKYGRVYMRAFERERFLALERNNDDFEAIMRLSSELEEDFDWWSKHISQAKNHIRRFDPAVEIFSHASSSGWGAYCNEHRVNGYWNEEERDQHINYLELLVAWFGLKCFAKELRDCDVLLRIDNTTAIAYINKKGGVRFPKLAKIAKKIWQWCENKNLWIFASYIASKDNVEADFESRRLEPETEFALAQSAFRQIVSKFGNPEIDIFATRTNTKSKQYISWKKDPGSIVIDAFTGTSSPLVEDYPGCRNYIRRALQLNETPTESTDIIIASLSESSLKQYNTGLKKWWRFCGVNQSDPYQITVPMVLRFLTIQYKNGASYGTLNCFRSAIGKIQGSSLADDSRIKGFFKGVAKLKPPRAKYDCTWDPKIVLEYLGKLNSNDDLTLDELSKKLVTLLALVTSHRMQTLTLIDIRNIMQNEDKYEIKISENIKISKPGKVQPNLIIPVFESNSSICPAIALTTYLKRTKALRGGKNKLFVAIKKPHKAVGSQTLSRWIKSVLNNSGLDTSKFSAYSTRHASTSATERSGINVDLILKAAGWTKKSKSFARFYNRPVIPDNKSYALAILNQS